MNCIVFIGTHKSGSSYDAIVAAKSLNYFTVLLTDVEAHLVKRLDFACVDMMSFCNLSDLNLIRHEINVLKDKNLKVSAIVSFIEENCYAASLMAKEYGLIYFTPDAINIMLDKLETRRVIGDTPYSPFFQEIRKDAGFSIYDIEKKFPLILKEPMSSGSKRVIKINTYEEYENEFNEISNQYPEQPVLLEEYLNGPQFLVETITIDNNVHIIAIIEQEISYACRFIVTGYKIIIDYGSEFYQSLITAAKDIIKIIGLKTGPCHLELRYVAEQWKLIEANPRISGGAMNLLIQTAYGINLTKETIKIALGQEPDLAYKYKKETFAQYVIVNKEGVLLKVTGRNKALKCDGVQHVFIKPRKGQLLIPPLSMGHRYAYVIAVGNTIEEAMTNAKNAANQIQFYIKEIDAEILSKLTIYQKDTLNEFYKNKTKFSGTIQYFSN